MFQKKLFWSSKVNFGNESKFSRRRNDSRIRIFCIFTALQNETFCERFAFNGNFFKLILLLLIMEPNSMEKNLERKFEAFESQKNSYQSVFFSTKSENSFFLLLKMFASIQISSFDPFRLIWLSIIIQLWTRRRLINELMLAKLNVWIFSLNVAW